MAHAQPAGWPVILNTAATQGAPQTPCHRGPTREAQVLGPRLAHLQGGQGAGRTPRRLPALNLCAHIRQGRAGC
jgi:hypothetical protein